METKAIKRRKKGVHIEPKKAFDKIKQHVPDWANYTLTNFDSKGWLFYTFYATYRDARKAAGRNKKIIRISK